MDRNREQSGRWIGFCNYTKRRLYIRGMGVVPELRGRGIGLQLLQAVGGYAKSIASRRMYLHTATFLTRAIRFYELCGFVRCDKESLRLHGTPVFTMEKCLP